MCSVGGSVLSLTECPVRVLSVKSGAESPTVGVAAVSCGEHNRASAAQHEAARNRAADQKVLPDKERNMEEYIERDFSPRAFGDGPKCHGVCSLGQNDFAPTLIAASGDMTGVKRRLSHPATVRKCVNIQPGDLIAEKPKSFRKIFRNSRLGAGSYECCQIDRRLIPTVKPWSCFRVATAMPCR